ncbi:MAG: DUF4386 domain-containing protein [Sphingobium sp.]|nr:DUF4386 domain-containing protein [Sphingobium sp.]
MTTIDPGITARQARWAGFLYLGTILCGLFAELVARGAIRSAGAGAFTEQLGDVETLYRTGELADLAMLGCYLAVTVLLHRLFAPRFPILSPMAAAFSLTGIAILGVAGMWHLLPVVMLSSGDAAGAALYGPVALRLHGITYGISLIFFGGYCLLIGGMCWQSRFLPRATGALMMLGGIAHLVSRSLWIVAPSAFASLPGMMLMLPLLGELALALWLLAMGVPPSPLQESKRVPATPAAAASTATRA